MISAERVAQVEIDRTVSVVAVTPGQVDGANGCICADKDATGFAQVFETDVIGILPDITGFQRDACIGWKDFDVIQPTVVGETE